MATVSYTRMADMTEADLRLINADADEDARALPARLMNAVAELERFQGPLKVSRLEHSLQSATRAPGPARTRSTSPRRCSTTSATPSRPTPTATWSPPC
jgi:hypothetical protein